MTRRLGTSAAAAALLWASAASAQPSPASGYVMGGTATPAGTVGQLQVNASGAFGAVAEGTSTQVLTSNGPGVAPTFQAAASGGSGCPVATPCSTAQSVTAAGALSIPAYIWTGAPITGGSATTTLPLLYVNDGAAVTSFSTGGTEFGINAPSGFAGLMMDFHLNGAGSIFKVDQLGDLVIGNNFTMASGSQIIWSANGILTSSAAGNIQLGKADVAAPVAQTLSVQSVVAGTSNTAGVSLTIQGSRSTGTGAGGSIILATGTTGTTGTAQNAAQIVETLDTNQHVKFSSAAIPTIGAGTVTANSTDVAGSLTTGTTVTSVVLSFKIAYATAPFCVVADNTATVALTAYSVSTTAITMTMTANTGHVVSWVCHGG